MVNKLEIENKPYIIIEGMVDNELVHSSNFLKEKYHKKVMIYAGALRVKYGIATLIEAFSQVKDKDAELWLYGNGDMQELIDHYVNIDRRIKYLGVLPNSEVIREQVKSTILVNPRPTTEEFTKYSFPSKNLEYMVSGTPILTTKLHGMPDDYLNYIYLFESETTEGMAQKIENVLSIDREILHNKGQMAKDFVLENKNNIIQAKKIITLIDDLKREEASS